MRLSASKSSASSFYSGLGEQLYDLSGARPALDLNFASNGSLVDSVTGKSLVTHTRASNATYVDGDGIIKDAVTNLLTHSEDWSKLQASNNSSVTTDATVAPNGTSTADKIEATTTGDSNSGTAQKLSSISANTATYTASWFVKKGNTDQTFLQTAISGGTYIAVTAALDWSQSPATFAYHSQNGTPSYTIHPLEDRGDGWYRASISITNNNTGTAISSRVYASSITSTVSGDYVYVWGAQLEESSTAGEYVKTTSTINSAPRFDHNPTTGESLGLLVEESRTNALVKSEEFGDSAWINFGTTEASVSITNPAGGSTAFKLSETAATQEHGIYQTTSTSGDNTFTVFAKAAERRYIVLRRDPASLLAVFDLQTGTVTQTDVGVTASITNSGNGWYRCSMTCANTGNTVIKMALSGTGISSQDDYEGDGTSGLYLWGAQLEAGSFPTSYIRTEGSTATRSADVASITGTNFSSWYNQTEGTVFADAYRESTVESNDFPTIFYATDGSDSNRVTISYITSALAGQLVTNGGTSQATNYPTGLTGVKRRRIAGGFKENDFYAIVNGVTANAKSDDDGTMPSTIDQVAIGAKWNGQYHLEGTIARIAYWPTRLSNDTLQTITR